MLFLLPEKTAGISSDCVSGRNDGDLLWKFCASQVISHTVLRLFPDSSFMLHGNRLLQMRHGDFCLEADGFSFRDNSNLFLDSLYIFLYDSSFKPFNSSIPRMILFAFTEP